MMAEPEPSVAPFESCVACFKGDTTSAVFLEGEAEFAMAALERAGLSTELASATVLTMAEQDLGCASGMVPAGEHMWAVRLCSSCALRSGLEVAPLDAEQKPVYRQSDLPGGDAS